LRLSGSTQPVKDTRSSRRLIDPGQSGASLERPGMDRVRDLVAAGGVHVVLAQDRDRIAREPAYHSLLRREFEEHGTKIRAMNDRGDDSPEGELTDGILDQLAKYERAKIAERTRRGMLRKAREGRVVVTRPAYGFRYNEARDAFIVCEPEMAVVEKVLRLAADGLGQRAIQTRLFREGVPSPTGKPHWDGRMIRKIVDNDAYRPHTFEEISALLAPEVAATLDPDKEYGVQWYNRQRVTERTISEPDGNGGRRYRKTRTFKWRPREEWMAAPVPAQVSRSLVDLARSAMDGRSGRERKYLSRPWELRGLMRCRCGRKMKTRTAQLKNGTRYHYYHCPRNGRAYNCKQKCLRAEKVEATVWDFVCGMLKHPERIRAGMDRLIAQERDGRYSDPEREAAVWAEKAAECARLRGAYQDQQAAGLMTLAELGSKLEELESTRRMAEAEIAALAAHEERAEELERDRDALLELYAGAVPEALDRLDGEERNRIYRMLRLEITPQVDGILDVRGILSHNLRSLHENGNVADDFVLAERHLSLGRPLVRNGSRLRDRCYVAQHHPEMAGASRHNEEVPQLVETEDSGHQVGTFQTVDQSSGAIDETAAEDPGRPSGGYRPEDRGGGDHGEPPHGQIDPHREPAWGVHPQKLEHDAAQRQRPDQTKQSSPPATVQREHADGGVRARYEDEDRHVVQPPQPRGRGRRDGQQMVKGARPVQRDEAETKDAESHELVHPAGRLPQKNDQRDQS
jgi:site-specific DNA recombinase